MAVRSAGLVDVDVVSLAVGREEIDSELVEQRVHARLVRRDPLAAELVGLSAELGVPEPPSDPIASFEHDDVTSCGDEPPGGREPRNARADDGDVGLDQAGIHASLPQRRGGSGTSCPNGALHVPGAHWSDPQT